MIRDDDDRPYDQYGGLPPHERESSTSYRAAVSVLATARTVRARVYRMIVDLSDTGATDDELERALGIRHQSVSARRKELVNDGLVIDSGHERKASSGRDVTVWIAGNESTFDPVAYDARMKGGKTRKSKARQIQELQAENERLRTRIAELETVISTTPRQLTLGERAR